MKKKKRDRKKFSHIKKAERLEIAVLLQKKYSHREIADVLDRDHTSVDREIAANSVRGKYQPQKAQHKSSVKRKYAKYQGMKIHHDEVLENYVKKKLRKRWSPEEISGRLRNVDTRITYVSSRAIYKWCYSVWGQRYCKYLPKQRYYRRKRRGKKMKKVLIPNRKGLEERPEAAATRSEFGHYESDTFVSGKKHKVKASVSALVERKSRYTKLQKIRNLKPAVNARAIKHMSQTLVKFLTCTFDNGIENTRHEELRRALRIDTYFCDPYSSWQKGTIENTIGRVRRFIPKGANLNDYSARDLQHVETWLNVTPRKCLSYKTPEEVMLENKLLILK